MEQLYNGDCLAVLNSLETDPKKTVIITSPPYNMNLRLQNGKFVSRWKARGNETHFATKYNEYLDDLSLEDYYNFQSSFIQLAMEKASTIFYNIQMVTGNKIALLQLLGNNAPYVKDIIIWDKLNGQPAMNEGCLNSRYEFIIVFSKEDGLKRSFHNVPFKRGTLDNLWQIKREVNRKIKAGFPRKLIEKILDNFVIKDTVIIDPFMGSGTTGVVCKNKGFDFIGIELSEEMFKIAGERIKDVEIIQS